MLVNGQPSETISALDRGLAYGDGVFRTIRIRYGKPLYWQRHFLKLKHDCDSIRISCPSEELLLGELQSILPRQQDCVAKIIITRGIAQRGYAPVAGVPSTRIVSVNQVHHSDPEYLSAGIAINLCRLKLGHQPQLAGIKHLNRLENVLAARECQEANAPEGLLEDADSFVISGTRSNLFMLRNSALYTPDLASCGVAGVQRDRVMAWATEHDFPCFITSMRMEDLLGADEIFLVNSVIGLWPIRKILGYNRTIHPVSWQIQQWLNDENN